MGRGNDLRRRIAILLMFALPCALGDAAVAELPRLSDPQAADRFHAAAALQNRALYDLAADEWAAFARDYPADPLIAPARYQRGVCLVQLKRYADARDQFEALLTGELKLAPETEEKCRAHAGFAHFQLALASEGAERDKHLQAAVAAFDEQLKRFPTGPLAPRSAFNRCEALYGLKRLEAAISGYREIVERCTDHPQRAEAIYALGVAEQEAGELVEAASTFERFLRENPEHPAATDARVRRGESLLAIGEKCLAVGKPEEALAPLTVATALPCWSHSDDVLLALADAQFGAGRPDEAVLTIDRLANAHSESRLLDRCYLRRAEANAARGEWKAAEADYVRLVHDCHRSPLVPVALLACARIQFAHADSASAESTLDRLLADHSDHDLATEARVLRATVRHRRGDFARGIEDADAVLAADTKRSVRSDALYVRGLCQIGLRQPAEAAASFARIEAKDPQYHALDRVLYDLAWAYQESHDATKAIATFAKLAETRPESPLAPECWYRIGDVHYAAGEYANAVTKFQAALDRATDAELRERAAHKLAWCHFEQQRFADAEDAFRQQIAAHPEGALAVDARLMVAECEFRQSRFREALESFSTAIDEPAATAALRQSALLHAAQSAAQVAQWQRCLELADQAAAAFPAAAWIDEARCERGTALFHLHRLDEAEREFMALATSREPTSARAKLMIGKIHAARGDHDAAVRAFFQVAYGYGDRDAPEPYREWQAESLFEAARSLEQTDRVESAHKLYEELKERFPTSVTAANARTALERTTRR